jgi:hypothetical protein
MVDGGLREMRAGMPADQTGVMPADQSGQSDYPMSATTRKPMWPVVLSAVFDDRAATR